MSKMNTPTGTPAMDAPQAFRDMADKGTAHAKASYEKVSAATTEASQAMQNAHSSAVQGAVACNTKVVEFARINSNAAFDYATKMFAAKSPSEFIEMSADHARKQFEILSGQGKELAALGQRTMLEAVEPLKAGAAKMFQAPRV